MPIANSILFPGSHYRYVPQTVAQTVARHGYFYARWQFERLPAVVEEENSHPPLCQGKRRSRIAFNVQIILKLAENYACSLTARVFGRLLLDPDDQGPLIAYLFESPNYSRGSTIRLINHQSNLPGPGGESDGQHGTP